MPRHHYREPMSQLAVEMISPPRLRLTLRHAAAEAAAYADAALRRRDI